MLQIYVLALFAVGGGGCLAGMLIASKDTATYGSVARMVVVGICIAISYWVYDRFLRRRP